MNAGFKLISGQDDTIKVANKTGWSGSVIHDAAIVFAKNPYVLVILSNLGESGYQYLFDQTSEEIATIHNSYWSLKMNKCDEIEQY